MAFEIPDHFHRQFTTNTELLLQEKAPVLLQGVMTKTYSGEAAQVVKQFGSVDFQEKESRHADTVWSDIQHKQRWIFPTDYTLSLPVDKEDELRMLDSPLSPYVEAMRAGWARKVNAVIRDALLGTSQTGKNGATATVFDTTNSQIAHGGVGLTIAKLRTAREKFRLAFVDESDPLYIAVGAQQITNLLATTEVTSSDYNTVKALVAGEVDTFMGFKFISYENLTKASTTRSCIAWAKSGAVLGQWNGLETKIGERADKEYTNQVFMRGTIGATRTHERKVIEIQCTEA